MVVQHQVPVDFREPQGNGIVAQKTPLAIHIKKIVQHRLEESILVGGSVLFCWRQGQVYNADNIAFTERTEGDGALLQVPAGGVHGNSIAWMGMVREMGWCFCFFCNFFLGCIVICYRTHVIIITNYRANNSKLYAGGRDED